MTEFTEEKLAELRAVAEAANAEWSSNVPTVNLRRFHTETYPPTVLALIAALEAKTYEAQLLRAIGQGLITQRDEAREERDDARAALKAKDSYVGDLEEQLKHIKSLWRATGRAEADAHRRADRAEATIEWVRIAATEVANQGDNHGRTHYENCWQHHLHCLAAKIIYETGADDE